MSENTLTYLAITLASGLISTYLIVVALSPVDTRYTVVECKSGSEYIIEGYVATNKIESPITYIDKADFEKKTMVLPEKTICTLGHTLTKDEERVIFVG